MLPFLAQLLSDNFFLFRYLCRTIDVYNTYSSAYEHKKISCFTITIVMCEKKNWPECEVLWQFIGKFKQYSSHVDIGKWCYGIVEMHEVLQMFNIWWAERRTGPIGSEINDWNCWFKALQLSNRAAQQFSQWPGSSWPSDMRECAGLLYSSSGL